MLCTPAFDGGPKRHQLQRVEPFPVEGQHGQVAVRVDGRVAVAGEVLGRGDGAGVLHAAHEGAYHGGDQARVFAESADVDDRVQRVVVHVGHRRVELVHAQRTCFAGRNVADCIGVIRVAGGADGHGPRKTRRAADAHGHAPFGVLSDEQRQAAPTLQFVGQHGLAVGISLKEDDAAHLKLLDQPYQLAVVRIVHALEDAACPHGKELADLLRQRQRAELGFGPGARTRSIRRRGIEFGAMGKGQQRSTADDKQQRQQAHRHGGQRGLKESLPEFTKSPPFVPAQLNRFFISLSSSSKERSGPRMAR